MECKKGIKSLLHLSSAQRKTVGSLPIKTGNLNISEEHKAEALLNHLKSVYVHDCGIT